MPGTPSSGTTQQTTSPFSLPNSTNVNCQNQQQAPMVRVSLDSISDISEMNVDDEIEEEEGSHFTGNSLVTPVTSISSGTLALITVKFILYFHSHSQ